MKLLINFNVFLSRITIVIMMLRLFIIVNSSLTVSSVDGGLIENTNRDLIKKRRLLGECEANCGKNRRCAPKFECAKGNGQELMEAGFHKNSSYCSGSSIDPNKHYCYDPAITQLFTGCTNDFKESCMNNTEKITCLMGSDPAAQCCRVPIENINETHAVCAKYQTCTAFGFCNCPGDGTIRCLTSSVQCPICVN